MRSPADKLPLASHGFHGEKLWRLPHAPRRWPQSGPTHDSLCGQPSRAGRVHGRARRVCVMPKRYAPRPLLAPATRADAAPWGALDGAAAVLRFRLGGVRLGGQRAATAASRSCTSRHPSHDCASRHKASSLRDDLLKRYGVATPAPGVFADVLAREAQKPWGDARPAGELVQPGTTSKRRVDARHDRLRPDGEEKSSRSGGIVIGGHPCLAPAKAEASGKHGDDTRGPPFR